MIDDRLPEQIERGRAVVASGGHAPARGEYLGRITYWGIDVYENSPQEWKDMLMETEQ